MKVNGYLVPQDMEKACLDRMAAGEFRASDLSEVARVQDASLSLALRDRIADRLIQREKRYGKISPMGNRYPYWRLAKAAG